MRTWIVLLLVFGLLVSALMVAAKAEPFVEAPDEDWGGVEGAVTLPDGLSGFFLAGRLATRDDVDAVTFTTTTPLTDVRANVLVPICGTQFEAFYPSVAIVGAGLPLPEATALDGAPFTVPDGEGLLLLNDPPPNVGERARSGWEYFNQYVYTPEIYTFDLPEAGTYSLVVWEPNGGVGAYMLDAGVEGQAMLDSRDEAERESAFSLLLSGRFKGTDCRAA